MATDNAAQVGRSHDFVAYSYLASSATRRASSRSLADSTDVLRSRRAVTRNPVEPLQGAAASRSIGPGNSAPRSGCKAWRLAEAQFRMAHKPSPARLGHRLGPGDMSLEAKRFRHVAIAIPEVRVSRGIVASPCQQSPQPQQPDVAYHQTLIGWRGR